MKRIILALIIILCHQVLFAQQITIIVKDEQSKTNLTGATIQPNGNKTGVITDKNGSAVVNCTGLRFVNVSFVGYQSQKIAVADCNTTLVVALKVLQNQLEDVEITATSNQNKSTLYQPVSIAKITETEIKRGNGLFLDDAINSNMPGVSMNRRTVSAGQQFNIRGYGNGVRGTNGLNSNFDGQGYKVYLNNIALTDAEGITMMDDIDFGSIGNVEIVKGPAGSLYGLAIAGAVNLSTIQPQKKGSTLSQQVLLGNYGLKRYTTQFQTGNEKANLLLNYGYQESDGFMSHNASNKRFVNIIGNFQLTEKQKLTTYFAHTYSYDERGGELTLTQWANKDYTGNPEYIKRNAHSEVSSFRAGLGYTNKFSQNFSNTTAVFVTGLNSNVSSAGGWTDKLPINLGLRSTFDAKFQLSDGVSLSGITGVEAQSQYAQIMGYNMVANPANAAADWIVGAMRSNQATYTGTTSVFTEWTLALPQDLSITAGIGYSNMSIKLNDRFYVAPGTAPTYFARKYDNMVSPHVAINKVINKQVSLYAAYSKGYKAPVSSYFFIPVTGQVNTNLNPEIGDQLEIGTKGTILSNRLEYQAALFNAWFANKMVAVAVPLNPPAQVTAYSYIANGGTQMHKGLELALKYHIVMGGKGFWKQVTGFANAAFNDFKYGSNFVFQTLNGTRTNVINNDFSKKAVAGVPPSTFNAGLDFLSKTGLYGNVVFNYRDKMPITSDGANMATSYNLLNGKIGYQTPLGKRLDLDVSLAGNNLTGVQYYMMVFINQLPDAYVPAPLNTNWFGNLVLKYHF